MVRSHIGKNVAFSRGQEECMGRLQGLVSAISNFYDTTSAE